MTWVSVACSIVDEDEDEDEEDDEQGEEDEDGSSFVVWRRPVRIGLLLTTRPLDPGGGVSFIASM